MMKVMGTALWQNWIKRNSGSELIERIYYMVASDATLTGSLSFDQFQVFRDDEFDDDSGQDPPVIRADIHWLQPALVIPGDMSAGENGAGAGELATTDFSAYHGGDLADEITSLLSLALRVRCKPGGRWWTHGIGCEDLNAPPTAMDEPQPSSPLHPRGHEVLPGLTGEREIGIAESLIATYPTLSEKKSAVVMKAARQYQLGTWVANEDPNLAWIRFVGALEVAANDIKVPKQSYLDRARDLMPDFAAALDKVDGEAAEEIAKSMATLIGSQRKFLRFLKVYCPQPPDRRPSEHDQVDWESLEEAFKLIYSYRSTALHGGQPFPQPMCEAPRRFGPEPHIERPTGLSSGAYNSSWSAADCPMLLATFEYITQGALVAWWEKLGENAKA